MTRRTFFASLAAVPSAVLSPLTDPATVVAVWHRDQRADGSLSVRAYASRTDDGIQRLLDRLEVVDREWHARRERAR